MKISIICNMWLGEHVRNLSITVACKWVEKRHTSTSTLSIYSMCITIRETLMWIMEFTTIEIGWQVYMNGVWIAYVSIKCVIALDKLPENDAHRRNRTNLLQSLISSACPFCWNWGELSMCPHSKQCHLSITTKMGLSTNFIVPHV